MSISYAVFFAKKKAVIAAMSTFEETLSARIADLDAEIEQLQGVWHGAAADA